MKIGFIGTGNMGGAILKSYAGSAAAAGNEILLHNRTTEHNEAMASAIRDSYPETGTAGGRIRICNDNRQLEEESDIIIIGVKPKDVPGVLREISPTQKIIISMAAGVSISSMEEVLEKASGKGSAKIIRIMPNTPALVGEGMTSMSRNDNVSDEDFAKAKAIFDAIGISEEIPEDMIDCVIGVSGSSPAYTYMYIDALTQAAVHNGMDKEEARIFAAQAVLGAAKMVLESRESIEQLRINVCSPGGTTIEAVDKLFANGFMDDVKEGFQAAVDKSKEMTASGK